MNKNDSQTKPKGEPKYRRHCFTIQKMTYSLRGKIAKQASYLKKKRKSQNKKSQNSTLH